MRLPFADQAGIAQLHGFLEAPDLLLLPLTVVPYADGKVEGLAGMCEIGGNGEARFRRKIAGGDAEAWRQFAAISRPSAKI